MTILSGASLVLPDRVLDPATLVVERDRIVEILPGSPRAASRGSRDLQDRVIVPGFIDVHVHGVEGHDTLDPSAPVGAIARRVPKYGVTAFCPTTVACGPRELAGVLQAIRSARERGAADSARVLPAHLESNFISPEYRGAQPLAFLRPPPGHAGPDARSASRTVTEFDADDILATIREWRTEVGIVTLAPELEGALPLIERLVRDGHRVSLGHSGASFEEGLAGVGAGARHATHLFNRMPPLHHRTPGLVGAVLARDEVAAEIVCDGYHVHPAVVSAAVRTKRPERVMAITDGTAVSGLPAGSCAVLGGRRITARETAAFLDDGTLAGSVLTMDRAFRFLVRRLGLSLTEAATMCASTPARELGLVDQGRLEPGRLADFVVLDRDLQVCETWIGGTLVHGPAPAG